MNEYAYASNSTGLSVKTLREFFSANDARLIPGIMTGNHLDDDIGNEIRLKLMLLGIPFKNGRGTRITTSNYPIRRPSGTPVSPSPVVFRVTTEPFLTLCKDHNLPTEWNKYKTLLENQYDFWKALEKAEKPNPTPVPSPKPNPPESLGGSISLKPQQLDFGKALTKAEKSNPSAPSPKPNPPAPFIPHEYQTLATAEKAFDLIATLANSLNASTNNWGPNEKIWDILMDYAKSAKPIESVEVKLPQKMPPVIAFINLKGGVAKTTTAVGTAMFLASKGMRVLVIDLDPQASASLMLVGEEKWKTLNHNNQTLKTLFEDVIRGEKKFNIESAIQKGVSDVYLRSGRIDLLASSVDIFEFQDRLLSAGEYTIAPVDYLRLAVEEKLPNYDYVLIDCPPNLGLFTKNGLRIASHYIIPTIPDSFSTYGIAQIVSLTKHFMEKLGREIECLGVVATKVQENNDVHIATMQALGAEKYAPFFKAHFKQGVDMTRASEYQRSKSILSDKWKGNQGAHYGAFFALVNEILEKLK